MTTQATAMLVVPEPFDKALKLIRQALTGEAICYRDGAGCIRQNSSDLGVDLAPCRILSVDNPFVLLEAMALDGTVAVFLPLHVAVSADGQRHGFTCSVNPAFVAVAHLSELRAR